MTLVELLVAVSILVTLVAISVPMFKPMLESQKTAGGARTVAMALERARVKAMESGQSCGVSFERYTEGNESNLALRLRLVKLPKPFVSPEGEIVSVAAGGGFSTTTNLSDIGISNNDLVQFNFQGRYYPLSGSGTNWTATGAGSLTDATYKIIRKTLTPSNLRSVLAPTIVMPRGTVVDLKYSGLGLAGTEFIDTAPNPNTNNLSSGPVVIMFSPSGTLDRELHRTWNGSAYQQHENRDLFPFFCIGEWDRGIDIGHEDGKNNIQVGNGFWVTLNPKTGEVRVTEMYPVTTANDVQNARKFAAEHYVNLGGQ